MRFNVNTTHWLSDRVREKISQMEKNRINKDVELVISSTRTRTQKVTLRSLGETTGDEYGRGVSIPPPPSKEQVKNINKIAAVAEQKRLQKKAFRRSRDRTTKSFSWVNKFQGGYQKFRTW